MFVLKSGEVSVQTRIVYKDYTRHPLDRETWEVARKVKTIEIIDKQRICKPG